MRWGVCLITSPWLILTGLHFGRYMYVRYCKNSMIFLRVVSYNASRAPGFFLPRPGQFIFRQIQTCGGWFQHRDGGYGSTIRHRLTYRIRRYWTLEPSIFLGDFDLWVTIWLGFAGFPMNSIPGFCWSMSSTEQSWAFNTQSISRRGISFAACISICDKTYLSCCYRVCMIYDILDIQHHMV